MSAAVVITRTEHSPAQLRALATQSDDATQARRLLAIALVQEGTSRFDAARQAGMDRQTLRCQSASNSFQVTGVRPCG